MAGLLAGLALTCFGLYLLGSSLTAQSSPYGFGFLAAAVCLLPGVVLLMVPRRPRGRGLAVVLTASLTALTAGLLQLPPDRTESGPLCRAGNGNVYDCDDPRIDEPSEKADVVG